MNNEHTTLIPPCFVFFPSIPTFWPVDSLTTNPQTTKPVLATNIYWQILYQNMLTFFPFLFLIYSWLLAVVCLYCSQSVRLWRSALCIRWGFIWSVPPLVKQEDILQWRLCSGSCHATGFAGAVAVEDRDVRWRVGVFFRLCDRLRKSQSMIELEFLPLAVTSPTWWWWQIPLKIHSDLLIKFLTLY